MGAVEGGGQGGQTPLGRREKDDAGPDGEQVLQVQHKLMISATKIQITFAFRWLPRHQNSFCLEMWLPRHLLFILSQPPFTTLHF